LKAIKEGILIEGNIEKEIMELREKISNTAFFQEGTDFLLFPENKEYYNEIREIVEKYNHNLFLLKKQESFINENKETLVIKKRVRSGQTVEHDGDVLLLSDLAPGGKISATGSVYIIGSAQGDIHAGNNGNRGAKVVANNMDVSHIRIAELIAKNPDIQNIARVKPEVAFINDDGIIELEEIINESLEKYEDQKKEKQKEKKKEKKGLLSKIFSKN
jgi:septum site-determining protein MinC